MKVAVALSGGVDSSVSAALLKQKGYEVIGVTMIVSSTSKASSSVIDVQRICKQLNIPHYTYNLINKFNTEIIDYFCSEYKNGRTPNPCPLCNKIIKFGELFNYVKKEHKVDFFATGHYARIKYNKELNKYQLLKGIDNKKDQSYMLYKLTQEQLKYTLFPLGNQTKEITKKIAMNLNLPIIHKKESQDVCFIEGNLKKFLNQKIRVNPGEIINNKGEVLGYHKGIIHYTIGQRKGLGISYLYPLYVTDIIPETNKIIVGHKSEVLGKNLIANDFNVVSIGNLPKELTQVQAKIRYNSPLSDAIIETIDNGKVLIKFKEFQEAITPGQSVVVYKDDILIGGGIIQKKI